MTGAACNIDRSGVRKRRWIGAFALLGAAGFAAVQLARGEIRILMLVPVLGFTWVAALCFLQAKEKV